MIVCNGKIDYTSGADKMTSLKKINYINKYLRKHSFMMGIKKGLPV